MGVLAVSFVSTMPTPNAEPDTERLPDYHELTSTRQAEHARNEQYRKDTFQLRTPRSKPYLALIIFCYAAVALSSWVITCNIGRGSVWKVWKYDSRYTLKPWRDPAKGSQQLRAAKILAAIAGVLTLPTVASVYSYAAVSFAQYRTKGQKLSIRQTLALANQDWMSPLMLLFLLIPTQNRRLGSRFFWFGCFLTILGLAIWPVQQAFLEPQSTTKARSPRRERDGTGAYDIPQLFRYRGYNNLGVVRLRKAMDSFSRTDCNPHLWHGAWNDNWCAGSQTDAKFYDQPSFSDFFRDDESNDEWNNGTVFMAQMPSGFNTGFERAWIPRFNTSVDYEQIGQSSAPSGCFTNDSDVDLIKHRYDWEESEVPQYRSPHYWSVRTCISSEALHSPLKNETRDRQDFEEVFYLNISGVTDSLYFTPGTWKISARTSVGYFELPNYHNDGTPGPLLEKFTLPEDTYIYDYMYPDTDGSDWDMSNSYKLGLEDVPNKGPLTTIYTALFSNNSFLDAWSDPSYRSYVSNAVQSRYMGLCEDVLPMGPVIEAFRATYNSRTTNVCLSMDASNVEMFVAIWLANFADADIMRAAFRMAAFMANEINFLEPAPYALSPGYTIGIDLGVDVTAPVMPLAGIIVGSILLGLFLLLLIALAVFAASTPHWTDRLDAYATLKMGAAMALSTEGLAKVGSGAENALDRAPGFVGDAMPESEVGRLAVGAKGPLRRRRYEASVCGVIPE